MKKMWRMHWYLITELFDGRHDQAALLTDGLEALQWVRDTDEVLPIDQTTAGVIVLACLSCWWEMRGAVHQPEALMFVQQNNS